ncbi:MAG: hypothetical protein ACK41P_11380, partial [Asticcacaulis sp.]
RLQLNGLPAGLVISEGDYIGLRWVPAPVPGGPGRALVRVLSGGGAVASGSGQVTVTVEPPLPGVVPSTAVAYLNMPVAAFQVLPESDQGEADRRQRYAGSLKAIQVLR